MLIPFKAQVNPKSVMLKMTIAQYLLQGDSLCARRSEGQRLDIVIQPSYSTDDPYLQLRGQRIDSR